MSLQKNNNNTNQMATIEEFKSAIVRIRDILRREAITGMESMRTICVYILARTLSIDKCKLLDIPECLAWDNIYETLYKKDGGNQYAFDYYYNLTNPDAISLINCFDKHFKTQKFAFDIKKLENHKEIITILNKINLEDVDYHTDIIGFVYEQHLGTGSSSANRDLGQFFTDRSICKYMTELCNPKVNSKGIPESICDPTMGTAGFLTSAIKHLNKSSNKVDWKVQNSQIYGFDHDVRVTGLANLNMFVETGFKFSNLDVRDTLHNDLPQTGYDVILANMPFGIKGLKHADVCERVKSLGIRGTKSEPLFLQLMMVSLNKGGRCAVVVPDGVLINKSTLHDGTRQYLLDNFELKKVIKMDGSFFMNTGIKPSILFFENTGNSSGSIDFCEVSKNTDGTITEKLIVTVEREELDDNHTLDMRKFIKGEETVFNSEFEMVKLGELVEYTRGYAFKSSEFKKEGVAVLKVTNLKNGSISFDKMEYTDQNKFYEKYLVKKNDIIIAITGSTGNVSINNTEFEYYLNQNSVCIRVNKNSIIQYYLFYYLRISNFMSFINSKVNGSTLGFISIDDLLSIEIPLPPLEIQKKIVETLDRIYGNVEERNQMISDIRLTMRDIIQSVEYRGFDKVKLEDILEIVGGKGNYKRDDKYTIPYYDSNGITGYVEETLYSGEYIITARNMSIGSVHYVNGPFYPSDHTINFTTKDSNVITNRFFYYWLKMNNQILINLSSGIKPGIRKGDVEEIEISLPSLELQKDIVRRLDSYESKIKSLEELMSEAEDNAKFILDSYLNANKEKTIEEEKVIDIPEKKLEEVKEEPVKPKKKLIIRKKPEQEVKTL